MDKKVNCWDRRNCGKGPDSDTPCIVATHSLSDGFLDGENGSRACFFIKGTSCFSDDSEMSIPVKIQTYCQNCDFYLETLQNEGLKSNFFFYFKHVHTKLQEQGKEDELSNINLEMFNP